LTEPSEQSFFQSCHRLFNKFDYIITFQPQHLPQYLWKKILFTHVPVPTHSFRSRRDHRATEKSPFEKTKLCSIISSPKRFYRGHYFRHKIINRLISEGTMSPEHVYGFFSYINEKSEALLPYRFSLVIENSFNSAYISEKILDCYLNYTYPIYIGSAISKKIFDPKSFIYICPYNLRFDDLTNVFHNINCELYEQAIPSILRANKQAKRFANVCFSVQDLISNGKLNQCMNYDAFRFQESSKLFFKGKSLYKIMSSLNHKCRSVVMQSIISKDSLSNIIEY